jgi:hypothetical protein
MFTVHTSKREAYNMAEKPNLTKIILGVLCDTPIPINSRSIEEKVNRQLPRGKLINKNTLGALLNIFQKTIPQYIRIVEDKPKRYQIISPMGILELYEEFTKLERERKKQMTKAISKKKNTSTPAQTGKTPRKANEPKKTNSIKAKAEPKVTKALQAKAAKPETDTTPVKSTKTDVHGIAFDEIHRTENNKGRNIRYPLDVNMGSAPREKDANISASSDTLPAKEITKVQGKIKVLGMEIEIDLTIA